MILRFLTFSVLPVVLLACGQALPQANPKPGEITLKQAGFMDTANYSGKGSLAFIQQGSDFLLRLQNDFEVSAGPDLYVWLVKDEADLSSVIDLGKLQAFKGAQDYILAANTQITDFSHVYIWCKRFSVLFAKANLTENPTPTDPPTSTDPSNNAPVASSQTLSTPAETVLAISLKYLHGLFAELQTNPSRTSKDKPT